MLPKIKKWVEKQKSKTIKEVNEYERANVKLNTES
jgi:hypothetical protein